MHFKYVSRFDHTHSCDTPTIIMPTIVPPKKKRGGGGGVGREREREIWMHWEYLTDCLFLVYTLARLKPTQWTDFKVCQEERVYHSLTL